jgi:hypothetical protein
VEEAHLVRRSVALLAALALVGTGLLSGAGATPASQKQTDGRWDIEDVNDAIEVADEQHSSPGGHLPGQVKNVKRISRLRVTDLEGGIADVAYYKGYAYLNKWSPHCPDAGTVVVDVRDPSTPKEVAYLPAGAHDYTTEGAHAFTMNTSRFAGDVYVVSHESCDDLGKGGISLWDVSDPKDPWPLARHFGDDTLTDGTYRHDSHSAMGWSDGKKAYVVAVDNLGLTESALGLGGDVDIFDITDPGQPVQIADFSLTYPAGLLEEAQAPVANGANSNHHDMWVRKIDRDNDGDKEWTLMLSYWDSGWIMMDISDPANPSYIDDSDYPEVDDETAHLEGGPFTPEGNAHQGDWNHNAKLWLGTDEDFAPYRAQFTTNDDPPATFDGSEFSWTPKVSEAYEDGQVKGPVVYGGEACDDPTTADPATDSIPNAADYNTTEDRELILVVSRGTCFFSHKVHNAQNNGWDAVIVGQSHAGTLSGLNPDAFICGSQGHEFTPTIVALCTGHRAMHDFFDDEAHYEGGTDDIEIGVKGDVVTARADIFDGWGYLNLLSSQNMNHLDTYAPAEVHDPACASDCGIMSVHEVVADPRKNLAYLAWYGLGLRVVEFSRAEGIKERGVYMDIGGNDFWGVELMERGDKRPLILMSDRDSGLWIFKYTGPE